MCTKFLKKIIIQVQKGTPTPSEKTKKNPEILVLFRDHIFMCE